MGGCHRSARRAGGSVRLARAYDPPGADEGWRILVDRVWPRGVARATARIDEWMPEVAPSDELRRWFGHDPDRWEEFHSRYRAELEQPERRVLVASVARRVQEGTVTLVYGARDRDHNQAVVLAEALRGRMRVEGVDGGAGDQPTGAADPQDDLPPMSSPVPDVASERPSSR